MTVVLRKIGRALEWLCSLPRKGLSTDRPARSILLERCKDGRFLVIQSFDDTTWRRDVCQGAQVKEVIESWTTEVRTVRPMPTSDRGMSSHT